MSKYDSYPVPAIVDLLVELCPEGVESKSINELGTTFSGLRGKKKSDFVSGDSHFATYTDIFSDFTLTNTTGLVSIRENENQNCLKKGDILFTASSETPEEAAMSSVVIQEPRVPTYLNSFSFGVRPHPGEEIIPTYIAHVLRSPQIRKRLVRTAHGVTRFNVSKPLLGKVELPIPPLEVQEQIATILDTFTDLDAILNRELELREEQTRLYLGDIFASDEMANSDHAPLSDLLRHVQPGKYQVSSTDYDPSAPTPVLSPGKGFLLGYTDETDGIFDASSDNPTIIFDDFTTNFHWVDFPFKVKSSAMKMLVPRSDDLMFRYVYWAMKTVPYKPTEHQRQWLQTYSRFEIPLPPLDAQEQIVDTLDMFTDYTDNLRREIDLRRQQLEHYREQLLTFPVAE